MNKDIYGLTIVTNANSVDNLMLMTAEILKEFSDKVEEGVIDQSAFLQGGGRDGQAQLVFTHAEDLEFSKPSEPDSPDLPPVDIPEEQEEIAADIPPEVMEVLNHLKSLGAKLHFTRMPKE